MRVAVFGMGTTQIIITAAAISMYAYWQGVGFNTAMVIGLSLSLSSTAIVMQLLKDKGEITSPHGQSTFAILLMQDIAVVPLIALIPMLSDTQSLTGMSVSSVLTPILAVMAVLLGTRYVIRPALPYIARFGTGEVFTGFSLLTVLGAAWLMDKAGMSMAMGAFLVGLMLSGSRYVHQIEADMESFRGILLGLFFMAVGMSIDINIIANQGAMLLQHTLAVLMIKGLVIYAVVLAFGHGRRQALRVSLLLPQSGEFGFILFGLAFAAGIPSPSGFQMAMVVIALTMAITPLTAALSERIGASPDIAPDQASDATNLPEEITNPVVIIGFQHTGETVALLLKGADIPFMILENDSQRVEYGKANGYPVYYGDPSSPQVLKTFNSHTPRLVIITLSNLPAIEKTLQVLRDLNPDLNIISRASDFEQSDRLRDSGVFQIVPEAAETGLQLSKVALSSSGVEYDLIEETITDYRQNDYRRLREALSSN
jgi:glutathione-regulated potassium-efflux system protein KefB